MEPFLRVDIRCPSSLFNVFRIVDVGRAGVWMLVVELPRTSLRGFIVCIGKLRNAASGPGTIGQTSSIRFMRSRETMPSAPGFENAIGYTACCQTLSGERAPMAESS